VSDARLVYSTDGGDRRRSARSRPAAGPPGPAIPDDGIVRVFREKGGRGGKVVTVVRGLPGGPEDLKRVAADLKRLCGAGGTVSASAVEIQGDHREKVAARLAALGLRVKLAGG
jgi:translation initiation factor 1